MNSIERSKGRTKSEQYLVQLADRTFLNLWSFPNLYYDKKERGKGDGKELCDLLVVCGDHVLIFSDRTSAFQNIDDIELAWRRWFKTAVKKSADQIRGANRWLDQYPERVFLDKQCTKRLPLQLSPTSKRKVHGIVVALGAGEACRKYFDGGIGSLVVAPHVKGDDHVSATCTPFAIGDIDPTGSFIHVFDDATLDIVMHELDTVTDLTDYLSKKEALIRSSRLIGASGEEDLVAYYMTHLNAAQEHDFTKPDGTAWNDGDSFTLGTGHYAGMLKNEQYLAKKSADEVSYAWDRLIRVFTDTMLAGTTIVPQGETFQLNEQEEGVRHMALVPRHMRREYGRGIIDALQRGASVSRMTRAFLPGPTATEQGTAFFFMTLAVPNIELEKGYEQYRQVRRSMLETYALVFLQRYRNLKRIVGIATEPPGGGGSEDLILAAPPAEWSVQFIEEVEQRQRDFTIAQEGNYREYEIRGQEFPEVSPLQATYSKPRQGMNRAQRRAHERATRRRKPS